MFIQNLNSEQQSALLSLAKDVMEADGVKWDEQESVLGLLTAQSNPDAEPTNLTNTRLEDLFSDQTSKNSLLLELLGIAHANGDYHPGEQEAIRNLALKLNIPDELVEDMESWVKRQTILMKEAQHFLEEA